MDGYNYPWTNLHDLNLDWMLNKIRELENRLAQPQTPLGYFVNVKDFGAMGDGTTDDTAAIQAAIDSLDGPGTVFLPAGIYKISSTIILGDGAPNVNSTYHNVKLLGEGCTYMSTSMPGNDLGTELQWFGAAGDSMLEVHGPIIDAGIEGLTVNGRDIAGYGVRIFCSQQGTYRRICARSCSIVAFDVTQWPGQLGNKTTNNIMCLFEDIYAWTPFNAGATAFHIGGDPGNNLNDTNMCQFNNISLFRAPDGINLHIDFCDASSFRNVICWCNGASTTGHYIYLDGTVKTGFPGNVVFEMVSGTMESIGSIGHLYVTGYGVGDGESLPDTLNVGGITGANGTFGTFTPVP